MADIAVLGLSIDSRQVVSAKQALDGLTASAKPAAAAAAALEKSTARAGKGATALAAGTGLARHEMINLSRQIQDVGVSLASGQSPFMVMVQQGAQIADIFGSSKTGSVGGALKQIGRGIYGFLGPIGLATAAIGSIAAASLFAVTSVANMGKALDDASRVAGESISRFRGLQSAASIKGIESDDFFKAMERFSLNVQDAKSGMGQLAETFRANGATASTFTDHMAKAADLIKNAGSDAQRLRLLQEMGLPANMQWVRYMMQGGDAIKRAADEAGKFGDSAEANLIAKARKFDEEWNKGIKNASAGFRGLTLEVSGWFDSLSNKATGLLMKVPGIGGNVGKNILFNAMKDEQSGINSGTRLSAGSDVSGFYAGTGAGVETAGPKVTTAAERQKAISDRQTYLGLLGQTISAEQAAEQVRLQADATYLSTGVAVNKSKLAFLQQEARERTIGVSAIKAGVDAANIDAATVGMATGKANEYAAAQNALNAARAAGRKLEPEDIASIRAQAAALGAAAQNADTMRFAYTNLVQGPMQAFNSAIQQGATAMDALKKAGVSALNALSSKLMDMAAQNLWGSAFGGSSGGGGLLAGLFGGGGSPTMSSGLGAGTGGMSFPMFAAGTNSAPGGWSIVGEKGPELMNVPKGAQILPNGVSPAGGGPPVVMNDNRTIHIGAGASQETVAQLKTAFAQDRAQRFAETVAIVKRAKSGRNL